MSKLVWDQTGERLYETGVSNGVLFPMTSDGYYDQGVAWNGLTSVSESPSGGEATAVYADNIKYLNLVSAEELGGTIEAYMAPDEFAECDGTGIMSYVNMRSGGSEIIGFNGVRFGQQKRKQFGLAYKTKIGNDTESDDHGYKIHIVYGCLASPSEKSYQTINDSPEAMSLSWEFSTTPIDFSNYDGAMMYMNWIMSGGTIDRSGTITTADGAKYDYKQYIQHFGPRLASTFGLDSVSTLKPTALVTVDSTKVSTGLADVIETILFGSDTVTIGELLESLYTRLTPFSLTDNDQKAVADDSDAGISLLEEGSDPASVLVFPMLLTPFDLYYLTAAADTNTNPNA